jgi:hypothetical protein
MTIEELNECILKNDSVGYSKVVKKIGRWVFTGFVDRWIDD